eukprot:2980807-Prymnesium_polylepis.1
MVKERALLEAAGEARVQAILLAKKQRFRYPELKEFAEAVRNTGRGTVNVAAREAALAPEMWAGVGRWRLLV